MAVELRRLYEEIVPEHDVKLLTYSCFDKKIEWVHMVENADFISLLHGDELVFNSMLNEEDEERQKQFIEKLMEVNAGGLIAALQEGKGFSEKIIAYCNEQEFPLFQAKWETSYLNIMRRFSEILLLNERNEMNMVAAIKNAIFYPGDEGVYLPAFERNGFSREMNYIVVALHLENEEEIARLKKEVRRALRHIVFFEDKGVLFVLCASYTGDYLKERFSVWGEKYEELQIGIGTEETSVSEIYRSYRNAIVALQIVKKIQWGGPCCYDEIGVYQILSNVAEPQAVYPPFIRRTLGVLYEYDQMHGTDYMDILKLFFDNDCSITQTANATYYHQNTLKYKVKAIKEILGYDIMSNENRMKIMISFQLLKVWDNFWEEA